MFKNNLRYIMADRRIDSISELIRITKLSRKPLNKLWDDKDLGSLKLETLAAICDALGVKLSELIEYYPEPSKNNP